MPVSCPDCLTTYSDSQIKGVKVSFRCTICGNQILLSQGDSKTRIYGKNPVDVSVMSDTTAVLWYIALYDKQIGPISTEEIKRRYGQRNIHSRTYVWKEGMPEWMPLSDVSELAQHVIEDRNQSEIKTQLKKLKEPMVPSVPILSLKSERDTKMIAERDEHSDLFSLEQITQGLKSANPSLNQPSQAKSGLIDMQSMTTQYMQAQRQELDHQSMFGDTRITKAHSTMLSALPHQSKYVGHIILWGLGLVLIVGATLFAVNYFGEKSNSVQTNSQETIAEKTPVPIKKKNKNTLKSNSNVDQLTRTLSERVRASENVTKSSNRSNKNRPNNERDLKRRKTTKNRRSQRIDDRPEKPCDEVLCLLNPEKACCRQIRSTSSQRSDDLKSSLPIKLSRDDIKKGMAKIRKPLRRCGRKYRFQGKGYLSFRVNSKGRVIKLKAGKKSSGLFRRSFRKRSGLKKCVSKIMKKVRFPRSQKGYPTLSYPFRFK